MSESFPPEIVQPSPEEIREFSGLVLPYMHLGGGTRFVEFLSDRPESDRPFYTTIMDKFRPARLSAEGEDVFGQLIIGGDFGRLLSYAETAAADIARARRPTLPGTFAAHAIVSAVASHAAPPIEVCSHSPDRTTYFLTQMAARLALELPADRLFGSADPFAFSRAIAARAGRVSLAVGQTSEWMASKMFILSDRLFSRRLALRAIAQEEIAGVDNLESLQRNNTDLFHELRRLRRFAIGPATYEGASTAWTVRDLTDFQLQYAVLTEQTGAEVHPERWRPVMVMLATEHEPNRGDGGLVVIDTSIRVGNEGYWRHAAFMDENGELFSDMYGAMPLRPLYEQAGKAANYEVLRQFLLQKYFDLTMPAGIVEVARRDTQKAFGVHDVGEVGGAGAVRHDLLSPRLRIAQLLTPERLETMEEGGAPEA